MRNYPPGVDGREPEVAGPAEEYIESLWCETCGKNTAHDVTRRDWNSPQVAKCWDCGGSGDPLETIEDENPDPDGDADQDR